MPTTSNPTNAGTPRRAAHQSTRDALAPYAEGAVYDPSGDTRSLNTYEWLAVYGTTIKATEIDLGIEL